MRKRFGKIPLKLAAGFFILLLPLNARLTAQGFDNESRAVYIMDIARYVRWSKSDNIPVFRIGILEPVPDLVNEINQVASARGRVQGKPVEIIHFPAIDDLVEVNLLYLNRLHNYDISLVLGRTRGQNTLLISENYDFHRSMINFMVHDGQKSFEINEDRMNQEGLYVSELFREHAITTEADWHEIYNKVELELEKEKMLVAEQNRLIEIQYLEIEEGRLQIGEQKEIIRLQDAEILKQNILLHGLQEEIEKRKNDLGILIFQLSDQKEEIALQLARLENNRLEMKGQDSILKDQDQRIIIQENLISGQNITLGSQLEQIEKQRLIIWFFIVMLLFAIIMAYFIYKSYRIKKNANIKLEEKNSFITLQRNEIEKQRDDISAQRDRIKEQNKMIWDSIHYAKRIQQAILPDRHNFGYLPDHFFIFYRPKDVVSGDFYWEAESGDEIIIVAADCTGHGVPGALMSMLGVTFLNDIVNKRKITCPSDILNNLRDDIISTFNQGMSGNGEITDGMDIAVCNINLESNLIQFSGANNPLVIIRDGDVYYYKGDRMPAAISDNMMSFSNHVIDLKQNDQIYIFSDGYIDQFGGANNKKFMRKQLFELLLEINNKPMQVQKNILTQRFDSWRGDCEQTDDVVMIGLKI